MDQLLPYQVYNSAGDLVLQAQESCRHSKKVEQDLLEHGHTIKLNGKKITKKEAKQWKDIASV